MRLCRPYWATAALLLSCVGAVPDDMPCPTDAKPVAQRTESDAWFLGVGMTNYRPALKESEALIDAQINGVLGKALGGWDKPETFKDWSDRSLLWDLWLFAGRDISPRWTWWLSAGGSWAPITNDMDCRFLGIPIRADVDFSRLEAFVAPGITWYPFGKPALSSESKKLKLREMLSHARPFLELGAGYVFIRAEATVKVASPLGRLFKQEQVFDYHLAQVSPRVGVEIPVSKNNRLALVEGYYFFNEHQDEFNTPTFTIRFSHRFGNKKIAEQTRNPQDTRERFRTLE